MLFDLATRIETFSNQKPYKVVPYSKKNWGHPLHSLCSYQGKLKPSLAHWLIRSFTLESDIILDPLGGVGTVAFEASLLGRRSISNDLSPFPFTIASAKLSPPDINHAKRALTLFTDEIGKIKLNEDDYESAEFGLNAKVKDYYHPDTLEEILKARRFFLDKTQLSQADFLLKAALLHILHGNRPYALSRHSHPITPFHPIGDFEYRALSIKLQEKIERASIETLPSNFVQGQSIWGDFRNLPSVISTEIDCIITSPPFLGMRFDRPNWLRLWFCGWIASDFHETSKGFLERQQTQSLEIYSEFFEVCHKLLKKDGLLILHLGGSQKHSMVKTLIDIGKRHLKLLDAIEEGVQDVETHGIQDKGLTDSHNFLFFEK